MSEGQLARPQGLTLHAEGILAAEYNYIAQTAFQSNEDRARVSQFFFVSFGTFTAALFSSQLSDVDSALLYTIFLVIFPLLALFGMLTLLQLTRLRQAWLECAKAMNQLKEGLWERNQHPERLFRWTSANLPPALKLWSIGFFLASTVSLIVGLSIGSTAAFFVLARGGETIPWLLSLASGIGGAIASLGLLYVLPLARS